MPGISAQPCCSAEVERDLDGAGLALADDRGERIPPLVEAEAVGQHATEVDALLAQQREEVFERVALAPFERLVAERVGADQAQLLEVPRRPLEPAGRAHPELHEGALLAQ